ncbi:MAG: hypothetical protein AAF411_23465 [Myxococcota bacterium]
MRARKSGPIGCGALLLAYVGAYIVARICHWLVWNGHAVAGPDAGSHMGAGWTNQELVFLPLCLLEALIRAP